MFPRFSQRYAQLPERMRAQCAPTPVASPRLVAFNRPLAEALGFDLSAFNPEQLAEWLSGNTLPEGALPVAAAYAGHQFGNFVPQLGDGRAILLGEVTDSQGRLQDIQLKGSGRTPFSRGGDGRAPLGPVLREYLVSEAMHALGIPTTRALAAVSSGERVYRRMSEPGAVLTRVATSHLRVGTFQYFAARRDNEALRLLADEAITRHYPQLIAGHDESKRYLALLEAVVERQAALVAHWMGVGFIHGVMNTDNAAISGETIDYGPCAFMDSFHPDTVFSSIDERGRYAWGNQPRLAQWNMARFAETLIALIDTDADRAIEKATQVVEAFSERFEAHWLAVKRAKLGLETQEEGDTELAEDLLTAMRDARADFTLTFRRLADVLDSSEGEARLGELFDNSQALQAWLPRWRERLTRESDGLDSIARRLRGTNPAVIPRNHRVEQALEAAAQRDDYASFEALLAAIIQPFDEPDGDIDYTCPPQENEKVLRTFCGT